MIRLLIIKPSSLGDIVHGLQLATSLQAQVPGLRIDWVARDVFAPLVRQSKAVERVHVFARRGGLGDFLRLIRQLREVQYDLVFDLQGLLRSGLMTAGARAQRKVGRSDAREGASMFYHESVPLPAAGGRSHAVDILLQFAKVLGAAPELRSRTEFRPADTRIDVFEATGPRPIVLFPDSRRPEKCWPHFEALTEQLLAALPSARFVWAGSAEQQAPPRWPANRFANLTGRTALESLPELLAGAALVIGNDSGPMHLAAAMDVPVLAIFGPTDPALYGPYPLGARGRDVIRAPAADLSRLGAKEVAARVLSLISNQ
jgi:heptosyltransferase I